MAAVVEYTEEQLNYYRICYITTDILTEGLRAIFKQEWDHRYKATWRDDPKNGLDFLNGESPRNRKKNARLLTTMLNGNRAEWDCTMLFYALLFSDCIHGLNPIVRSNVDNLRLFRNEEFAHMPRGHLSDAEFQISIGKVETAFQALGLSTLAIQDVKNQTCFPTKQLKHVLKQVDDLKQEVREKEKELEDKRKVLQEKDEQRQILEEQLHSETSSFCILPPRPSHDVAPRDCDAAEIMQQLKALKVSSENSLSYLYISGNPGSGKSQMASLVAKRFFDAVKEISPTTSFVMTLNAESSETLLESYVSFARHLKCPEYAVTNTFNSKALSTDEKIRNLKTLISTKIELYTSWLLIVDNVTNMSHVHANLPERGNEKWARGQLLLTTQDTASIPLTSSFIRHISVSKGMDPYDAISLLSILSGFTDAKMEKEIAQVLDYQPLALASAATYVREVRMNKLTSNFGWDDFLKKLNQGKRSTTEAILAEVNPSYSKPMTVAIRLAVEKAMTTDNAIEHTFNFLSSCAPQPLSLEIVVNYILNVDKEVRDPEMLTMRIRKCSLLLYEEEESGVFIRVHQIVHDVIATATKTCSENKQLEAVDGAVGSFYQFIHHVFTLDRDALDTLVKIQNIVPHLTTLVVKIEQLLSRQGISQNAWQRSLFTFQNYPDKLQTLGMECLKHCEFASALKYFNLALEVIQRGDVYTDVDKANAYSYIGQAYNKMGNFHHAKKNYEYEQMIRLQKLAPEHVDAATTYNSLGIVHHALGALQQAKECHDRALAIGVKILGPEHVDVATTYINLGTVHHDLGDLQQAKECHDRALAIHLKELGAEHVDVATTYNNLGAAHHVLGAQQQAKECYDRALAIRLKKLGPEHVDVATTYNNLGTIHRDLGDLQQAKECHDRALAIYLEKLGPEHVYVATTYSNLGSVHRDLGDLQLAKECQDRALAIRLKKLGPEHVDVATIYNNLGTIHRDLGDLQLAKECYDRALVIRLKKLGSVHVDVANTYDNLGAIHYNLGDLQLAKECYDRTVAICLKKLGPEHVHVATTYINLGTVHHDLGDLQLAKECYDRALAIRLKKLGPEHVYVANTYSNLGTVHRDLGDQQQAKECYDRALAIRLKKR